MSHNIPNVVLTALAGAFATLITSAISIVKLVNEKDARTTDYRQDWTKSARTALATLIGRLTELTNLVDEYIALDDSEDIKRWEDRLFESRKEMRESFAIACLHFNKSDPHFNDISANYEAILKSFREVFDSPQKNLDGKILDQTKTHISSIIESSRCILDREWKQVKQGEISFVKTKKYATVIGFVAIGTIAAIALIALNEGLTNSTTIGDHPPPINSATPGKSH